MKGKAVVEEVCVCFKLARIQLSFVVVFLTAKDLHN